MYETKLNQNIRNQSNCYIVATQIDLDFHHYYGLTELLETWLKQKKIIIEKEQDILALRESFIDETLDKVYDYTVTLCHKHHLRLHSIYGKTTQIDHSRETKKMGRDTERKTWHGTIDF